MKTNTLKWAAIVAVAVLAACSQTGIAADEQDAPDTAKEVAQRDSALRKAFESFPFIKQRVFVTNGTPLFEKIKLNRRAKAIVNGKRYDGFRFKAPDRLTGDFVWAWYQTGAMTAEGWYILPRKDAEGFVGFRNFNRFDPADLSPVPTNTEGPFIVQQLPKSSLSPGEEYVIWFEFADDHPTELNLAYAFRRTDVKLTWDELSVMFGHNVAQ